MKKVYILTKVCRVEGTKNDLCERVEKVFGGAFGLKRAAAMLSNMASNITEKDVTECMTEGMPFDLMISENNELVCYFLEPWNVE